MATNEQQYATQLNVIRERFPQVPEAKILRLLSRHNGDADQVRARLTQQEFRWSKSEDLEARFGEAVNKLQQEYPAAQSWKRHRLLRMMNRFGGDAAATRKIVQKIEGHRQREDGDHGKSRRERLEEMKVKYATQLAEIEAAGIHVHTPCIFRQLEKHQGDASKVIEKIKQRTEKKEKNGDAESKYPNELAQLQAEGIQVKHPRVLLRLLLKSNGDVNKVKELVNERQEKHRLRKEYKKKHHGHRYERLNEGEETGENATVEKKRRELSSDDKEKLKRLRIAGVRGNPHRVLSIFHECGESVEMTVARTQEERDNRSRQREERKLKRAMLENAKKAYVPLNKAEDWPNDIEQVYLDGNNMMFVVDSLRRLCLNRAGKKTERAIGEIAAAWNERLHIPRVDLVFDSTSQVDQIGSVIVSSAQPKYRTTDDMLVEIVRRPENREKNKRTVIVTSDRALATLLQNEGCQLIKPYNWFAHCAMILTPDLIKYEEITGMVTTEATPTSVKTRYNFDELVHRIAKIDL